MLGTVGSIYQLYMLRNKLRPRISSLSLLIAVALSAPASHTHAQNSVGHITVSCEHIPSDDWDYFDENSAIRYTHPISGSLLTLEIENYDPLNIDHIELFRDPPFPGDCHVLVLKFRDRVLARVPFTSPNREIKAILIDVTGDGVRNVLVQYGGGRGTGVSADYLRILDISEHRLDTLLSIQIGGQFWDQSAISRSPIVPWRRDIVITRANDAIEFVFSLSVDLPPKFVATRAEDIDVLFNETMRYVYDKSHNGFVRLH